MPTMPSWASSAVKAAAEPEWAMLAVAIDRRARTRSSGYVKAGCCQIELLRGGRRQLTNCHDARRCARRQPPRRAQHLLARPLQREVLERAVRRELDSRIWEDLPSVSPRHGSLELLPTRTTLMPLPFMKPAKPSLFHMRTRDGHSAPYAWLLAPLLLPCTWLDCQSPARARVTHRMIFRRSNGDTTVLLVAPARPPALSARACAREIRPVRVESALHAQWWWRSSDRAGSRDSAPPKQITQR